MLSVSFLHVRDMKREYSGAVHQLFIGFKRANHSFRREDYTTLSLNFLFLLHLSRFRPSGLLRFRIRFWNYESI